MDLEDFLLIKEAYGLERATKENIKQGQAAVVIYRTVITGLHDTSGHFSASCPIYNGSTRVDSNSYSVYVGDLPATVKAGVEVLYKGEAWKILDTTITHASIVSSGSPKRLETVCITEVTLPNGEEIFGQRLVGKLPPETPKKQDTGLIEI